MCTGGCTQQYYQMPVAFQNVFRWSFVAPLDAERNTNFFQSATLVSVVKCSTGTSFSERFGLILREICIWHIVANVARDHIV